MKYRILCAAKRQHPAPPQRTFRLCASQTLSRMARQHGETIDFAKLFEISDLPDLYREKPSHPLLAAIRTFFTAVWARLSGLVKRSIATLREKLARFRLRIRKKRAKRRLQTRESLYWLSGALCSTLCVLLLCTVTVVLVLMRSWGGIYRVATVPSLVGTHYEETLESDDRFLFVVDYQYNPDVEPGQVISQSPPRRRDTPYLPKRQALHGHAQRQLCRTTLYPSITGRTPPPRCHACTSQSRHCLRDP